MTPRIVYVLPATSLHGGNRVVFEHAEGLLRRGYEVTVVAPEPEPDWHRVAVPFQQVALDEPGAIPLGDICIGTFWTTIRAAVGSGAPHVFHFSQGFEGVHREYAPILDRIDAVYRLPIPKLLVSEHLRPVLEGRYCSRCFLLGQAIDTTLFSPAPAEPRAGPLRVGVVGPWGVRSKGIPELLRGLALARQAGHALEVHRASADPLDPAEEKLGVTDRYFHRLATDAMPGFYRGLDAYVHSSFDEEGFPLPPLEAMACGVPVALTRIRPFAVIPEAAVLRYPPGEPEAVVPVIAALADSARRRTLAAAGLDYARGLTLDKVLDRLEAAFAANGAPTAGGRTPAAEF